jgi:integrase
MRPWKVVTFLPGMAFFIWGAYAFDAPTWDVPVSVIMSVVTFLLAPWSEDQLVRGARLGGLQRLRLALGLGGIYLCGSGSYEFYHLVCSGWHPATYWESFFFYDKEDLDRRVDEQKVGPSPGRSTRAARSSTSGSDTHKAGPVLLAPAEAEALLSKLPERYRGAAVKARFVVTWETAPRPETIALLRAPGDYRPGQHHLRIREDADKARYARAVPLSPRAQEALDAVCPEVGVIFGHHTFTGLLRKAARDAGLPKETASKLTAYDFRHSRATYWVEHSQNLAGVAFLLGHKEVTTLNKYVKPGQRAAEEVLAQAAVQGSSGPERPGAGDAEQVESATQAKDVVQPTEVTRAETPAKQEAGGAG